MGAFVYPTQLEESTWDHSLWISADEEGTRDFQVASGTPTLPQAVTAQIFCKAGCKEPCCHELHRSAVLGVNKELGLGKAHVQNAYSGQEFRTSWYIYGYPDLDILVIILRTIPPVHLIQKTKTH